jgi:hypothetical protein
VARCIPNLILVTDTPQSVGAMTHAQRCTCQCGSRPVKTQFAGLQRWRWQLQAAATPAELRTDMGGAASARGLGRCCTLRTCSAMSAWRGSSSGSIRQRWRASACRAAPVSIPGRSGQPPAGDCTAAAWRRGSFSKCSAWRRYQSSPGSSATSRLGGCCGCRLDGIEYRCTRAPGNRVSRSAAASGGTQMGGCSGEPGAGGSRRTVTLCDCCLWRQ